MITPITRMEAIERMARGEKCETHTVEGWKQTFWSDFDGAWDKFRIPSEPRRVAQSWDGVVYLGFVGRKPVEIRAPGVTLREVLPGDVTLQRMTEAEAWDIACKRAPDLGFMSPRYGVIAFARALGLIGEGS